MSTPPIVFVSLILRNDEPIYMQSFSGAGDASSSCQDNGDCIKHNFQAHMALDIFSSPSLNDQYAQQQLQCSPQSLSALLLFVDSGVAVYGHETRTGMKIVLGVDNAPAKDSDIAGLHSVQPRLGELISKIFQCYMRTIFNPFTKVVADTDEASLLLTDTFDKHIKGIVEAW